MLVVVPLLASESYWGGTDFTHLSVFRSKGGPDGIYDELTKETAEPAVVPPNYAEEAYAGPSKALSGKKLKFILNEATTYEITFTGSDPLEDSDIIAQIESGSSSAVTAFPTVDGKYALETVATGNNVVLRVLESEAAPLLGLSYDGGDSFGYGKSARILLVSGTDLYSFSDARGETDAWYKFQYVDPVNNIVSAFSSTRRADQFPVGSTCIGTMFLSDEAGRPVPNAEVILYIADNASAHTPHRTRSYFTDATGNLSIPLVRGLAVEVHVVTTRLVRKITVPSDTAITTFDMLGAYGTGDSYDVAPAPALDTAIRSFLWPTLL